MAKHMLRVMNPQGFGEGPVIIMKCEKCPKYLQIDRRTMELWLTDKTVTREIEADKRKVWEKWNECEPYLRTPPSTQDWLSGRA